MKKLLSSEVIQKRVAELRLEIGGFLRLNNPLALIVLEGARPFAGDLLRYIELSSIEIKAKSYNGTESSGQVEITYSPELDQHNVIIIEDIIDTGRTVNEILSKIKAKSVQVCTLLNKPNRREVEVPIHYCGFDIPDLFVIGYGMDKDGEFRALEDIFI